MSYQIENVIGFLHGKVLATTAGGEIVSGDPNLYAELASDEALKLDTAAWAFAACKKAALDYENFPFLVSSLRSDSKMHPCPLTFVAKQHVGFLEKH